MALATHYSQPVSAGVAESTASALTMSSLKIAELTGKRHDNVRADVKNMAEELSLEIQEKVIHTGMGRPAKAFQLNRRETDILLTGYSVQLRAKVIDRWHVLENQVAKPAPANLNDPAALRGLLLGYTEQVLQLTHQVGVQAVKIEQDAPKVEVYHKIADSTGLIGFQKFCTQLGLKQREVKHWMKEIGWLSAHQYAVNLLPTAMAADPGYCQIRNYTPDIRRPRLRSQI